MPPKQVQKKKDPRGRAKKKEGVLSEDKARKKSPLGLCSEKRSFSGPDNISNLDSKPIPAEIPLPDSDEETILVLPSISLEKELLSESEDGFRPANYRKRRNSTENESNAPAVHDPECVPDCIKAISGGLNRGKISPKIRSDFSGPQITVSAASTPLPESATEMDVAKPTANKRMLRPQEPSKIDFLSPKIYPVYVSATEGEGDSDMELSNSSPATTAVSMATSSQISEEDGFQTVSYAKRRKTKQDVPSLQHLEPKIIPVYVSAKAGGKSISKINPNLLAKDLTMICGTFISAVLQQENLLIVKVCNRQIAAKHLNTSYIADVPVACSLPEQFAKPCAAIIGVNRHISNEALLEALGEYGVTDVRRYTRSDAEGSIYVENRIVISFSAQPMPKSVIIGSTSFQVFPYVSSPIRCQHCQKFRHKAEQCRSRVACGKCAGQHRSDQCISSTTKCVNCHKSHPADFHGCPIRLKHLKARREEIFASYGILPSSFQQEVQNHTYNKKPRTSRQASRDTVQPPIFIQPKVLHRSMFAQRNEESPLAQLSSTQDLGSSHSSSHPGKAPHSSKSSEKKISSLGKQTKSRRKASSHVNTAHPLEDFPPLPVHPSVQAPKPASLFALNNQQFSAPLIFTKDSPSQPVSQESAAATTLPASVISFLMQILQAVLQLFKLSSVIPPEIGSILSAFNQLPM